MEHNQLSDGEWKIMKRLWEIPYSTLIEITKSFENTTGWAKPTVHVMLKRMIAKGAVGIDSRGKYLRYYPLIGKEDMIPLETASFLDKVYDGSVSMMISALTEKKALSEKDIQELRDILDRAEKNLGN